MKISHSELNKGHLILEMLAYLGIPLSATSGGYLHHSRIDKIISNSDQLVAIFKSGNQVKFYDGEIFLKSFNVAQKHINITLFN
jgi:hypothetical protein